MATFVWGVININHFILKYGALRHSCRWLEFVLKYYNGEKHMFFHVTFSPKKLNCVVLETKKNEE